MELKQDKYQYANLFKNIDECMLYSQLVDFCLLSGPFVSHK